MDKGGTSQWTSQGVMQDVMDCSGGYDHATMCLNVCPNLLHGRELVSVACLFAHCADGLIGAFLDCTARGSRNGYVTIIRPA